MDNILYFPTRYFPAISGAEFYLQRMAEIFSSSKLYNVDIFTSNAIDFKALRAPEGKIIAKNDKHYEIVNNLEINRFPIDYTMKKEEKTSTIKKISEFKQINISDECLDKLIENGPFLIDAIDFFLEKSSSKYELIHTTFFPYFNLLISLIIGKKLQKPTICTPFFHFSNPRYIDNTIIEVLRNFDLLIACTNLEKEILMKSYGISEKKITVIPMGVDFNIFNDVHKTTLQNYFFKEKFFQKKDRNHKMVLFCGYKNYEKGAISILKSIPFVLEKYKKVYFIFIGPSTMAFNRELTKVQKLPNTNIINFTPDNLTGYYDRKKLTAFNEADVYLMPSRSDAFGIAFLEAWASGKPVIGANIGATPEVIRENIDGMLVEFDNPRDISDKLVRLLKKKRLREKIGNAGRLKVKQTYTWEIVADQTHKVYQNLIKTKN